jgi:UDP-N-acetylmuramyl pentapeptide phosphotransferase/UDP-N-acetylglucosamine-1-phosphate transferase
MSFAIAAALTPLLRWISLRHDIVDVPNERSSHAHPTPRTGGLAIVVALVATLGAFGTWRDPRLTAAIACGLAIAALGVVDDFRALRAAPKLAVHVIAAVAAVVLAGVTLREIAIPMDGTLQLGMLAIPVTLFWIVGATNAFNFMDGVNGIASIEAIVCGGAFGWILLRQGDPAGALVGFVVAAAAAGFLIWNAGGSIFMGDVGSGILGFLLAVLAIRLTSVGVPFVAAILPLLPFLFDTSVTLVRRIRRHERLFAAHRTHLYQQLTDLGWSHLAVSGLWGWLAVVCAWVAIAYDRLTPGVQAAAVFGLVAMHAVLGIAIVGAKARRGD